MAWVFPLSTVPSIYPGTSALGDRHSVVGYQAAHEAATLCFESETQGRDVPSQFKGVGSFVGEAPTSIALGPCVETVMVEEAMPGWQWALKQH